MVINYSAGKGIDRQTTQMKNVIESKSGYYSFIYQSPLKNPEKLIFFLLDDKNNTLYAVDLKL